MEAIEILSTLRNLGITAQANGNKLAMTPGSKVPPELVPEIRRCKAEILNLICQPEEPAGDGQLPPLDRPPATEMELRRLIDYLADPLAFTQWFERVQQTDSAKLLAGASSAMCTASVRVVIPDGLTKGQASDMLAAIFGDAAMKE
jgi:hypothetical protein